MLNLFLNWKKKLAFFHFYLSLVGPTLKLWSTGSQVLGLTHRVSFSMARGIFLDQGSNPCPLHWQAILNTGPPGKSRTFLVSVSSQLPSAQNNAILKWNSLGWHILLPLNTQHYKTMGKWKVMKVP